MNALSTGEIDVSVNIAGDYIKQLKDNPKLVLAQGPQNRIAFCGYNMTHPILSDKRVRDALSMAVDRAQIVSAVYANGDGIASALCAPPQSFRRCSVKSASTSKYRALRPRK